MTGWAGLILLAYLLGSISPSVLIVRRLTGRDVRQLGSLNPGTTNVLRLLGRRVALLVLAIDAGKGLVPVALGRWLGAPGSVIGLVALAAVAGHMAPLYHGFRGGKGVATAAGALSTLAPVAALLSFGVFVLVLYASRYVALASVSAVAAFPLLALACGRLGWAPPAPAWLLASGAAIAALVIVRHGGNLARIRAGTEGRIGEPPSPQETL